MKAPITRRGSVLVWLLIIIVAFFALGYCELKSQKEAHQEAEAKQRAADAKAEKREATRAAAELAANRAAIIADIKAGIASDKPGGAALKASTYLATKDPEITELHRQAKEKRLVIALRKIPASQTKTNRDMYAELMKLNPNEPKYREKFNRYNQRALGKAAKNKKELDNFLARYGEPPKARYDGTFRAVINHLKQTMNDPGSLDMDGCTKLFRHDTGWLVGCDYRGKNSFGALIRQSHWFTIRHGRVVKVDKASAYES